MKIDLQQYNLPPQYTRNEMVCFMDPIREKFIPANPEEYVRQGFAGTLHDMVEKSLDATTGRVTASKKSLDSQISSLNTRIEQEQSRLERVNSRLVAQYARLEKLLTMIQQQFSGLM